MACRNDSMRRHGDRTADITVITVQHAFDFKRLEEEFDKAFNTHCLLGFVLGMLLGALAVGLMSVL